MKKFILILAFLFSISLYASYESDLIGRMKPIEEKSDDMSSSAATTVEIVDAIVYASNEWDTELNKVYKLLMASLSKDNQTHAARNHQNKNNRVKNRHGPDDNYVSRLSDVIDLVESADQRIYGFRGRPYGRNGRH